MSISMIDKPSKWGNPKTRFNWNPRNVGHNFLLLPSSPNLSFTKRKFVAFKASLLGSLEVWRFLVTQPPGDFDQPVFFPEEVGRYELHYTP